MDKNIVLVGMSGCGKTTVARELASILKGYSFIDIDEEIEKEISKKISEIFEEYGEEYFRKLEKDMIQKQLCNDNKAVISLGGGAFENEQTRKNVLSNCLTVYLKASANTIYDRIKNANDRPLLSNISPEKIENLMSKRIPNFEKAHIKIDTDNKTLYNVVKEIKECLR